MDSGYDQMLINHKLKQSVCVITWLMSQCVMSSLCPVYSSLMGTLFLPFAALADPIH